MKQQKMTTQKKAVNEEIEVLVTEKDLLKALKKQEEEIKRLRQMSQIP